MKRHAGTFDFMLDTVSSDHDINAYLWLLKRDGTVTLVGLPLKPLAVGAFPLIVGRKSLSGSNIGGIRETQEMLDFCGEHGITADVETVAIERVNDAFARLERGDVRFRFVVDLAGLQDACVSDRANGPACCAAGAIERRGRVLSSGSDRANGLVCGAAGAIERMGPCAEQQERSSEWARVLPVNEFTGREGKVPDGTRDPASPSQRVVRVCFRSCSRLTRGAGGAIPAMGPRSARG